MSPKRRTENEITIRVAGLDDVPDLIAIMREAVAETRWNLRFNLERAVATFREMIESDWADVLLARENTTPAGFAIIGLDDDFHDEALGYVLKFYVRAQFRKTACGRQLAKACAIWFDETGARATFASPAANIGQDKLFQNLLAKVGYMPTAATMTRLAHGRV